MKKGLYFEAVIDDVERGNQAIKQAESGTLNQFSIGYSYVREKSANMSLIWGTSSKK